MLFPLCPPPLLQKLERKAAIHDRALVLSLQWAPLSLDTKVQHVFANYKTLLQEVYTYRQGEKERKIERERLPTEMRALSVSLPLPLLLLPPAAFLPLSVSLSFVNSLSCEQASALTNCLLPATLHNSH